MTLIFVFVLKRLEEAITRVLACRYWLKMPQIIFLMAPKCFNLPKINIFASIFYKTRTGNLQFMSLARSICFARVRVCVWLYESVCVCVCCVAPFLMSSVFGFSCNILLSQNVSCPVICTKALMKSKYGRSIFPTRRRAYNTGYMGHTQRGSHIHANSSHIHTHTEIHRPGKLYSSFLRYAACVPGHPFSLFPPLKYIFIFCCINFIFGMFRGFPVCPQAYFMYNFNTVSIHMCACVCVIALHLCMRVCVCGWVPRGYLIYKGL